MKTILTMSALAVGIVFSITNLSGAADMPKADVHATAGAVSVPPSLLPPKHSNYECTGLKCTCDTVKDCATMGADHVCQEGTFSGNTCSEKKY